MDFNQVNRIFDAYNVDLQESVGLVANFYFDRTPEKLMEKRNIKDKFQKYESQVGQGDVVAVVYSCHGGSWTAIGSDAAPGQVRGVFENNQKTHDFDCYDYDNNTDAVFYVKTDSDDYLVYIKDQEDSRWGFYLCDDDQSWDGGFGIAELWVVVDKSEVPNCYRERLSWLFENPLC